MRYSFWAAYVQNKKYYGYIVYCVHHNFVDLIIHEVDDHLGVILTISFSFCQKMKVFCWPQSWNFGRCAQLISNVNNKRASTSRISAQAKRWPMHM